MEYNFDGNLDAPQKIDQNKSNCLFTALQFHQMEGQPVPTAYDVLETAQKFYNFITK